LCVSWLFVFFTDQTQIYSALLDRLLKECPSLCTGWWEKARILEDEEWGAEERAGAPAGPDGCQAHHSQVARLIMLTRNTNLTTFFAWILFNRTPKYANKYQIMITVKKQTLSVHLRTRRVKTTAFIVDVVVGIGWIVNDDLQKNVWCLIAPKTEIHKKA